MRRLELAQEPRQRIRRPEDARVLEHQRDGAALGRAPGTAGQGGDPEHEEYVAHRPDLESARLHEEVGAPVLGPARLGVLLAHGLLLSVTQRVHPLGLDAARDEVVHRGLRATVAEGQVVGVRATLVAVALDEDERARVLLKPGRADVEDPRVARADLVCRLLLEKKKRDTY